MIPVDTIVCGDCLQVMKEIPDGSIDMILCDLPYGLTNCDWDTEINMGRLWEEYNRILNNGVIALTSIQPFTSILVSNHIKQYKYNFVWIKPQGVDPYQANHRPLNNIEDVLIFSNGKHTYNPQFTRGSAYHVKRDVKGRACHHRTTDFKSSETNNGGKRTPTRTLYFKQETGLHPTQKPVALFEYLIKTYTNDGDLVLDNCIGSGTTAVACKRTGRHFIGIEMESKYCEIARKRVAAVPTSLSKWGLTA